MNVKKVKITKILRGPKPCRLDGRIHRKMTILLHRFERVKMEIYERDV